MDDKIADPCMSFDFKMVCAYVAGGNALKEEDFANGAITVAPKQEITLDEFKSFCNVMVRAHPDKVVRGGESLLSVTEKGVEVRLQETARDVGVRKRFYIAMPAPV